MNSQIWNSPTGERIACLEKIKVMQQNFAELQQVAADLFADGILMGIDPDQLRQSLIELMKCLENPYK